MSAVYEWLGADLRVRMLLPQLFLYNGKDANRQEKAKGLELVHRIRDNERGGRAEIIIVNE
eukprot:54501-Eustigmatos_ZCMA.PRE.1